MSTITESPGIAQEYAERKRMLRNLLKRKAIRDHVAAVGGIGLPSKMPGTAYGISAKLCGVGGKLAEQEGTVCHDCYAMRNNYTYPSVMRAHEARIASLRNLAEWIEAWCHILPFLGAELDDKERYHRWHDSGDLQDTWHLGAIAEVARRNPDWRFWLPTKEYGIVRRYMAEWDIPSNLVVRLSAPRQGELPNAAVRNITGLTSTVGCDGEDQCPARDQGGFCGDCRDCWDASVTNKNYPKH